LNWRVEDIAGFPLVSSLNGLREAGVKAILIYPADAICSSENVAVPLSRLPQRWVPNAVWQTNARLLLEHLKRNGETLTTTAGMMGWDYLTWLAGVVGVRMLIILPPDSVEESIRQIKSSIVELSLDSANVTFIAPVASKRFDRSIAYPLRDKLMLDFSQCLYPLAIRPGGFWDKVISTHEDVDDAFRAPYPKIVKMKVSASSIVSSAGRGYNWQDAFIHMTRGVFGPWVGETKADYFNALVNNQGENPRNELATLTYILNSGILRGSGSKIRSAIPVVSFSTLNPYEILALKKTSPHRPGSALEPYGLAIKKEALLELGLRPVIYGEEKDYLRLSDGEKPFFQHVGKSFGFDDDHSWRREKEFRLMGDLDLTSLREYITAILPTAREAADVARLTGYPTLHLFE